ncbi:cytochrome c [Geomonas sp. Red276]
MKKALTVVAAAGCLAVANFAFGGIPAGTGVNGSLHDMTVVVGTNADAMGRVCVFCHTPHHAQSTKTASTTTGSTAIYPLWNHDIPSDAGYTPYAWATPMNTKDDQGNSFTITDPLAGPSRLCMSCHDGAIAIDQHGDAMASAPTTFIGNVNTGLGLGRGQLGKDLTQTHPIGFDYVAIAAWRNAHANNGFDNADGTKSTEIVTAEHTYATQVATNGTVQGVYNTVTRAPAGNKTIGDNLYNSKIMTCATCHEVHNKENATQDPFTDGGTKTLSLAGTKTFAMTAPNYFLYAKQTASLICLSCHVK